MENITTGKSMFMDRTSKLISKVLDFRSVRQEVISGNIANAETPGYIQQEIPFEKELQRANEKNSITLETSRPGHISINENIMQGSFNPGQLIREHGNPNELDIDKEMTKMAQNNLLYEANTRLLSRKFEALKTVISGGR